MALLIATGYVAAHGKVIRAEGIKDLSNLAFLVLSPALLFRTMGQVPLAQLDFRPVVAYFAGVMLLFLATLAVQGLNRRAAVLALACTFSNTVMMGIPLVSLAYGQAGLVVLLTLVSVHAVVLLTFSTVALELAVAREQGCHGASPHAHGWAASLRVVVMAARSAILHPVPLPIIVGLLFAQTGMVLPEVLDKPLLWLGSSFSPLALLLVGASLAGHAARQHWHTAMGLVLAKNCVLPVLVAAIASWLQVDGLHRTTMVVAASLPIGANVFLFSQRYGVAKSEVTAAVALSTGLGLLTVSAAMWWFPA